MVLLLVSAGVYRCALMITQEDGPADVFARLRTAVGQSTWIGRGLHCIFCVSWWLAVLAAVILVLQGHADWSQLWYLWPGIAGLAVMIYQVVR
jgi:hypothetical protein